MAVAEVGTTGTKNDGTGTTHTLSYNLSASANFLDCFVGGFIDVGASISGVTWNGVALTRIGTEVENNDGRRITAFRWDFANGAIPTGTRNLVVTPSQAISGLLIEVCGWSGVDSTTPISGVQQFGTGPGADASSPTDVPAVTSAVGDMVRGGVETAFNTPLTSDTSPQVEDANFNDALFGSGTLATAHEPGAASVTLLWTFSGTLSYSSLAYNIKASTGGGGNDLNVTSIGEPVIGGSTF